MSLSGSGPGSGSERSCPSGHRTAVRVPFTAQLQANNPGAHHLPALHVLRANLAHVGLAASYTLPVSARGQGITPDATSQVWHGLRGSRCANGSTRRRRPGSHLPRSTPTPAPGGGPQAPAPGPVQQLDQQGARGGAHGADGGEAARLDRAEPAGRLQLLPAAERAAEVVPGGRAGRGPASGRAAARR
jgi:hypothetical protein